MRIRKIRSSVLLVFCVLFAVSANAAPIRAQTAERYEVAALRNVMIAARDGVKLATDVYLPVKGAAATGRFPAIVERAGCAHD